MCGNCQAAGQYLGRPLESSDSGKSESLVRRVQMQNMGEAKQCCKFLEPAHHLKHEPEGGRQWEGDFAHDETREEVVNKGSHGNLWQHSSIRSLTMQFCCAILPCKCN